MGMVAIDMNPHSAVIRRSDESQPRRLNLRIPHGFRCSPGNDGFTVIVNDEYSL